MSDIRRDHDKSSSNHGNRNSKDENERYHRQRTNSTKSNDHFNSQRTSNIDAKVYIGNVPTDNLTDGELLDFFKPFGRVSDIRVYKGYMFVQYERVDDARKLIKEGQTSLMLKGNKLDVLPAMEGSSTMTKSPSIEMSYKDSQSSERQSSRSSRRYSDHDRNSSNYEPLRKRFPPKHHTDDHNRRRSTLIFNNENTYGDSNAMETNDDRHVSISSSRICSRRLSRSPNGHSFDSSSRNNQLCYTTLIGPDDPRQLVDCQIILVNPRQRGYGEEISSHLRCHGLITSVILLREDYTLIEAIENATREHCLYGIIAMPMHEERHTASFHILHGQTEEHRNLTLEDGYHIILTNFCAYKEHIRNKELNKNVETIIYPPREANHQDQSIPFIGSKITLGDKLPLSMLLCLLADGRQLTLDEIDRVLVYLLEKKSKMLTLPQGTLPPLPAQYATIKKDQKSNSATTDLSSSSELSLTIAEQIRQILSTNLVKSSIEQMPNQHSTTKNCFEPLTDILQVEDKNKNKNLKEGGKDYNDYQQTIQSEQDKNQSIFSYSNSNSNSVGVVAPSFHYSSSSMSNNGNPNNSFVAPSFSSYDSINQSLTHNSPLKQTTTTSSSSSIPNFGCQSSQYFYPPPSVPSLSNQNLYQTLPNSAAADAAAAIFQAYSQFNARPSSIPPMINQHNNTQQQIRK